MKRKHAAIAGICLVIVSLYSLTNEFYFTGAQLSAFLSAAEWSTGRMRSGRLWIHVKSFDEGLSGWRITLSEILVLARKLNGTLVEPCIHNGRLGSCREDSKVRLRDVFNMTILESFHSYIVPFEHFQNQTALGGAQHFTMCMQKSSPRSLCKKGDSQFKKWHSREIEQSIEASRDGHAVLEIEHFRKYAFNRMRYKGSLLVQQSLVTTVMDQYLVFLEEHHRTVDHLLQKMGIHGGFAVIQWRGELENMDYLKCAQAVLNARQAMNLPNTSFVLMSSLNTHKSLQWSGAKRMAEKKSSAHEALSLLMNAGFYKLDSAIGTDVKDLVFLAVWDLIIAMKADSFATCSDCSRFHFCTKCNYQGKFMRLAMSLRKSVGKESLSCWPT